MWTASVSQFKGEMEMIRSGSSGIELLIHDSNI